MNKENHTVNPTDKPVYKIESHFRGDCSDVTGPRCHFRRYVVDVYIENSNAQSGTFKIKNSNDFLYYLGYVPVEGINAVVSSTTEKNYGGIEVFKTEDITVEWTSDEPVNLNSKRQKIVRIMLCFNRWGMDYSVIEKHCDYEILAPDSAYKAMAGDMEAVVSANCYKGIEDYEKSCAEDSSYYGSNDKETEIEDRGKLLSRFAVMADTHVGIRYEWENYDWLYGVFDNISEIHKKTPLDFVLQLGDNIDDGYAETYKTDYEIYLEEIKRLEICDAVNPIDGRKNGKIPHYEMQGNHDTSMDTRFFRNKLWYTENESGDKVAYIAFFTDYGGYPLVSYDVVGNYESYRSYGDISDDMIDFVEQSILKAEKNNARHIVLCNHFGIAQDLGAPILPETGLGKIADICKKHNIKLYFNGHEHNDDFTIFRYNELYDCDVSMTCQKYAIVEIYENTAKLTIYNTSDHTVYRVDELPLS